LCSTYTNLFSKCLCSLLRCHKGERMPWWFGSGELPGLGSCLSLSTSAGKHSRLWRLYLLLCQLHQRQRDSRLLARGHSCLAAPFDS
jgi:hypothetical protein